MEGGAPRPYRRREAEWDDKRRRGTYACGGGGSVFSRRALEAMDLGRCMRDYHKKCMQSDWMIADCARKFNVTFAVEHGCTCAWSAEKAATSKESYSREPPPPKSSHRCRQGGRSGGGRARRQLRLHAKPAQHLLWRRQPRGGQPLHFSAARAAPPRAAAAARNRPWAGAAPSLIVHGLRRAWRGQFRICACGPFLRRLTSLDRGRKKVDASYG
mmetsp:Transcript_28888/g.95908  ORF Transcript_28888/g.95908 Transcript_28888/m.95908 type:complete len:214 (-) Transcript_28888:51-692(-)